MGKRFSLAVAIGALFAALSMAPAAAADELTSCVQGSTVCFYDGASIGDSDAVTAALEGKAKVAVVPNDDSNSLNPNQLATQVAEASGTQELILVVDMGSSDRFGVYSKSGRSDEILAALNGAAKADGGEAIVASDVASIYSSPVAGDGGGGFPILGLILPFFLLGAAAVTGLAIFRKKRGAPKAIEGQIQPTADDLRELKAVEISDDLRRELTGLSNAAQRYSRYSNPELQEASGLIAQAAGHIYELFKRIDRKKSKQNREIAQVRYLDITRKLNSTLSKDYFEDIVRNPSLWEKSDEKIASVLTALKSVDRQVIENIKQVNNSKEIEFRVAVDSLIGTDVATVEDAFGKDEGTMDRKVPNPFRR